LVGDDGPPRWLSRRAIRRASLLSCAQALF
jgi:hypothetical protein